ncbi:MAG: polyamine aminopropyltransferase [Bacteroidetes bacterium]|nr:polyamine aminopropyltransferase [Bacteroidota bacterium]
MQNKSIYLKLSLFATGFSGIVAEYLLATLASYFLGNSIIQWTMVLSTMLFAMGVGSRISKLITKNLLANFIYAELALSLLVGLSGLIIFSSSSVNFDRMAVYVVSFLIGLLIGVEIPLVTRINEMHQSLRVNISSVLENDYYGSLLGGVFFAVVAIPIIGITYTPYVLAAVNFSVALLLFFKLRKTINNSIRIMVLQMLVGLILVFGCIYAKPIELYSEQANYIDKVVYQEQTNYQRIVITKMKNDYWLYINNNQQLSTVDEYLYHEPMVHAAVVAQGKPQNVLVLGGGDGCAVRELLKYDFIKAIDLVDLDPSMTKLGQEHEVFVALNKNALNNSKVSIQNEDAHQFLAETNKIYDLIIIDLPDPKSVELAHLYSKEMYRLCWLHLTANGVVITQAGSPYFATKAFYCVLKTMKSAGFGSIPLHNQIVTMGEWGWILGHKSLNQDQVLNRIQNSSPGVDVKWLNKSAFKQITEFGKPLADTTNLPINTFKKPILYQLYLNGTWELY